MLQVKVEELVSLIGRQQIEIEQLNSKLFQAVKKLEELLPKESEKEQGS